MRGAKYILGRMGTLGLCWDMRCSACESTLLRPGDNIHDKPHKPKCVDDEPSGTFLRGHKTCDVAPKSTNDMKYFELERTPVNWLQPC